MTLEEMRKKAQSNYNQNLYGPPKQAAVSDKTNTLSEATDNSDLAARRAAAQANYQPQYSIPSPTSSRASADARRALFEAEQQEKYLKGTASKFWSKSAAGTASRSTVSTPNAAELNRRYVAMSKQAGILEGLAKTGRKVSDQSYDQHLQQFQKAYTDFESYQKKYQDYTSEETTRKRREETQRQLDQQLEAQRSKNLAAQYGYQMPDRYVAQLEQQGAKADQQEIDRLRRQLEQDDEILAGYEQRRETERLMGLDLDALKSELDAKTARQEELWQNYLSGTRGISWGATRESLDKDLAREIEDLQNEYNKAYNLQWRQTQGEQYGALANQSDFSSNSQYLQSNDPDAMLAQLRQQESELVYRLSNDPNAPASLSTQLNQVQQQIRDYQALQKQIGSTYHDMTGENDAAQRFQYATDQERAVYYYLVNTGRYQEAADYADYLDYNLNERRQAQRVENAQEFARNHPVLSTLASVPQSLASGVGQLDLMVQKMENTGSGKPVDFNTSWQDPYYSANTTRSTISQDLNEKYGTLDESIPVIGGMGAGNLYQIGTSALDSAAVLALTATTGLPPIVGTSLLGGAAATAASHDAHNRGLSDSQAIATGLMAGIWETMFEYIPMENLLKPSMSAGSLRTVLGAAAKQAGIEASEEFLTTAANTLSDLAINGDQSQIMGDYQRYLAQGDSASQAAAKTFGGALNSALQDALAGAISGGVMGGGKAALVTMLPTRTTSTLPQARPAVEQAQALASRMEAEADSARAAEGQGQAVEPLPMAPQQAQGEGQQVEMLPMVEQPATRQIETLPMAQPQTNENGLVAYTSREQENLSTGKRNFILRTVSELKQFISKALTQKNNTDRAYMGKIPDSVVEQVKAATGIDVSGFSFMVNGDDIRHIFNNHGDEKKESARGQIAVTPENLSLLPEVLSNPDRVYPSDSLDEKGRKAIFFEKEIDGLYITVQGVGNGRQFLQTDTVYIRKKKEPASAVPNAGNTSPEKNVQNALPQGSFGSSLPQSSAPVNDVRFPPGAFGPVDGTAAPGYNQSQETTTQTGGLPYDTQGSGSAQAGDRGGEGEGASQIGRRIPTGSDLLAGVLQNAGGQEGSGRNRQDFEAVSGHVVSPSGRRRLNETPGLPSVVGHTLTPAPNSIEAGEVEIANAYDIPAFVVEDATWRQIAPKDDKGNPAPAFSRGGQIYFQQSLPTAKRGTYALHELTHVMKQTRFQPYLDFVHRLQLSLDKSNPILNRMLDHVAANRSIKRTKDMSDADKLTLWDEFAASVYGSAISADTIPPLVYEAFHDFDAFMADMDRIHQQFRQRPRGQGQGQRQVELLPMVEQPATRQIETLPMVKFVKKIDGTYYAVEAVTDSKAHRLGVISAYMNDQKNGSDGQVFNMGQTAPRNLTPSAMLDSPASIDSVSQSSAPVNGDPFLPDAFGPVDGAAVPGYNQNQETITQTGGLPYDTQGSGSAQAGDRGGEGEGASQIGRRIPTGSDLLAGVLQNAGGQEAEGRTGSGVEAGSGSGPSSAGGYGAQGEVTPAIPETEQSYRVWVDVPGFAGPETFAEFLQLRLNHPQQWARLQRDHDTLLKIDQKPWTPEFKQKAVDTFHAFQKEGLEISDHGIARFIDRSRGKNGFAAFSVQNVIDQLKLPANYIQPDGRKVWFYEQLAIVKTDEEIIVSLIRMKTPKNNWEAI